MSAETDIKKLRTVIISLLSNAEKVLKTALFCYPETGFEFWNFQHCEQLPGPGKKCPAKYFSITIILLLLRIIICVTSTQFTMKGEILIEAEKGTENLIQLKISDTGVGMTEDKLEQLYNFISTDQKYVSVDELNRNTEGKTTTTTKKKKNLKLASGT